MITGLPSAHIPEGLTTSEVDTLLAQFGENRLPENPPPSALTLLINQFKSPLVYVLVSAGVVTMALSEYADTAIIGLAVFLNTILGFIQERKANNALAALKKMVVPFAEVIRDGNIQNVPIESLVPGDVVLIDQGDKIPADGIVSAVNRFYVTEAMLTGESIPLEKKAGDKVYMGTIVTSGKCAFVIEFTGAHTEMGKIAIGVSGTDSETPLGRQLKQFSKQLSKVVFFLLTTVFVLGVLVGKNPVEVFKTSVAMAVSAIPEGLLVALTVVLALGMQRILKRKGLVRNLKSAETLGGVTTICVDKTGTLTEGIMKVTEIFGDKSLLAEQVILANDLDDPIVIAAWEWGKQTIIDPEKFKEFHPAVDSIPFDSNTRLYSSLNKYNDTEQVLYINGAPEEILSRCSSVSVANEEILKQIDELSKKGIRLLGFARKKISLDKTYLTSQDSHDGFEWVGLLGFLDPIRDDVKSAFNATKEAGIRLVVITGDYPNTAKYVVEQMGITVNDNDILLGDELRKYSDDDLRERLLAESEVKIFARTRPEQKLRIVEVLKKAGEVVAMMGDGVNDAPALSRADIGIVVGEASDVAKEVSDLVLLDSRFSTIVAAIEEGRGIFDNIRKIILYLMCDAYEEILLVLVTLALNMPLPITAAQILWVNILSDGFPHLALTVDPKVPGLMKRKPRSSSEALVAPWMIKLIALVSVVGAVFAFGVYVLVLRMTQDTDLARSVTFATVGINSLIYVFSIRTLQNSFWEQNPFANRWLLLAVGAGIFLQYLPFYYPPLHDFLKVQPLGQFWFYPLLAAGSMFLIIEVAKDLLGRHLEDPKLLHKKK